MPTITSDKDLPKLLDTPTKQVKWAKKLVAKHLGSAAKRVDKPPMQGLFSRTLLLTLADGSEVVIQFRTEPLDLDAFKIAREALGSVVPDARSLEDEELLNERVWAYSFTRLHGKMWVYGVAGKGAEGRIAINRSLGQVFSKGYLASSSDEAIDGRIRPHLEAILASPLEKILPYRHHFQTSFGMLEQLKKLPLWVTHYDLNDLNVLVDENCQVSGLIDWECLSHCHLGLALVAFTRSLANTQAGNFVCLMNSRLQNGTFETSCSVGCLQILATCCRNKFPWSKTRSSLGPCWIASFSRMGRLALAK
ncbi:hypothetical protein F4677DRAFT_403940 [Hypoxylon crocopeplum]|nr:hypothetical protein F4677DRAFT_403940 [Hypoxylon crocopeplum]